MEEHLKLASMVLVFLCNANSAIADCNEYPETTTKKCITFKTSESFGFGLVKKGEYMSDEPGNNVRLYPRVYNVTSDSSAYKEGVIIGWKISRIDDDENIDFSTVHTKLQQVKGSKNEVDIHFDKSGQKICTTQRKKEKDECRHRFLSCVKEVEKIEESFAKTPLDSPFPGRTTKDPFPTDGSTDKKYIEWKTAKVALFHELEKVDHKVIVKGSKKKTKTGIQDKKGESYPKNTKEGRRKDFFCTVYHVLTCEELTRDLFFGAEDFCELMLQYNDLKKEDDIPSPLEFLTRPPYDYKIPGDSPEDCPYTEKVEGQEEL